MDKHKKKALEEGGWKSGTVADFLQLSPEESQLVEFRLRLSNALRSKRLSSGHTQRQVASNLRSSQSRLAKMESGDRSVTIDLLLRGLFHLGWNIDDVVQTLTTASAIVPHTRTASLGTQRIPGTFSFSRSALTDNTIEIKRAK
jgi:hypothetical protein